MRAIHYLKREGNYTEVHYGKEKPWFHRSLGQTLDSFAPKIFFRANPNEAFGLHHVQEIIAENRTPQSVILTDGRRIKLSQKQARIFVKEQGL